MHQPRASELAARDQFAHRAVRLIVAVRVADVEHDTRAVGRIDHRLGFVERRRHGLLAQHVLARVCGGYDVPGVKVGRRGDVDGIDVVERQ